MTVPSIDAIPRMRSRDLLAAINECQNAFEAGDDPVRMLVVNSAIYRELKARGMTELAIESFIRNLPNWKPR